MIHVGLGQFEGIDTDTVINHVISTCESQMGGHRPQAGLVFASIHFDHGHMLKRITDAFPGMELIGCTTAGDFSTAFGFSDDAITLMTLASDEIQFSTGVGRGLSSDYESALGHAVKTAQNKLDQDPGLCLALPQGYNIHHDAILRHLGEILGTDCPIFGGASGTDWTHRSDFLQFHGSEALTDAIPLLLMAGPITHTFSIANSWRPVGKKAVVNKSRERIVYRIDNMEAVDFYRHYLGHHDEPAKEFVLAVYDQGRDRSYVRAPIEYQDDGSIIFSEHIPQGAKVQLTEATREDLIQDTLATSQSMTSMKKDWEPAFALAFSCAFRKEVLGTEAGIELEILRAHFPAHLPIMGFYCFGEIGPLVPGGKSMAHGATLITLWVGSRSHGVAPTADVRATKTSRIPIQIERTAVDQTAFLKRKLKRSEGYRQRLEANKDFNLRMHRRIMDEVEKARFEIQKKEAALSKSEEKYRRIVQTTGESFILMDEELVIIDANQAYCQLVEYTRSEIIGKSNISLATDEFRKLLDSNREELLSQEYRRFEGALVSRTGRKIPILVHGNTLRDDQGEVIGYMAFITDMTDQKKALELAGEVQRSLLPQENPRIPGLDVAGRNVSCEEVGGDYYDFFWQQEASKKGFSVAVGDITGHGVDAALLMTSARAFLRMHASQGETVSEIVCAMNQNLAEDVTKTGRFMTLFYLTLDAHMNQIEWVRAGHDPAILYDSHGDRFEELKGKGIALGIDGDYVYPSNRRTGLLDGQVIAIGTDGIWECRNPEGEMFGRERFNALIRNHAQKTAADILNNVFAALEAFSRGRQSEDDVTLVIIKITKDTPE